MTSLTNIQNEHIAKIINKTVDGNFIFYKPYNINKEIVYANIILQKIVGDKHFIYDNPKSYNNKFGEAHYYNNNKFNFEKIGLNSSWINIIPKCTYPYENIAITNLWIVIDNPSNLKLTDLVTTIRFQYGGMLYQKFGTSASNIENEINILAYMFNIDGIKYENNKIYVPSVVFHNVLIFNNTYHQFNIEVIKHNSDGSRTNLTCEVYGNICDANAIPELENTDNLTHNCSFVFYKTHFIEDDYISSEANKIILNFIHPTYAIYIMNVSKEFVKSIKLFINTYISYNNYGPDYEYKLNDIEWFNNHVIIWFNRNFLLLNELNTNINFSCCARPYIIIENTYHDHKIEIVALRFEEIRNLNGMTGTRYSS
jgi:hypothetical protein